MITDSEAIKFWSRVDQTQGQDACWPLKGARNYGRFNKILAHRLAWSLTHGSIPYGLKVCHHCDNPPCCNPAHLFLGTQKDNIHDCIAKSRRYKGGGPKVTAEQVREIRTRYRRGWPVKALANCYGLSLTAMYGIVTGKTWREPT